MQYRMSPVFQIKHQVILLYLYIPHIVLFSGQVAHAVA